MKDKTVKWIFAILWSAILIIHALSLYESIQIDNEIREMKKIVKEFQEWEKKQRTGWTYD